MTSNVGAREIARPPARLSPNGQAGLSDKEIKSRVMGEVKKLFRPEFLNRIDEIIVFKSLTDEQIVEIVEAHGGRFARAHDRAEHDDQPDARGDKLIAKEGTDATFGARPLRRAIQRLLEDPLSEQLLEGKWQRGSVIDVDVDETARTLRSSRDGRLPRAAQARQHRARCRASAHELRFGPRRLAERGLRRRHGIGRRRRLAHESPKAGWAANAAPRAYGGGAARRRAANAAPRTTKPIRRVPISGARLFSFRETFGLVT